MRVQNKVVVTWDIVERTLVLNRIRVVLALSALGSSSPVLAQVAVPERSVDLTPFVSVRFKSIVSVHAVGTSVVVNDALARRLIRLNSELRESGVLLDSVPGATRSYGDVPSRVVGAHADSIIFLDRRAPSLLHVAVHDTGIRVSRGPRRNELRALIVAQPWLDAHGGAVMRMLPEAVSVRGRTVDNRSTMSVRFPDSVAVVRYRTDSGRVDTLAWAGQPTRLALRIESTPQGGQTLRATVRPIDTGDDIAVTPDGELIIVRGQGLVVERVRSGAQRSQRTPLQFDQRIRSASEKQLVIDSVNAYWRGLARDAFSRGGKAEALTKTRDALLDFAMSGIQATDLGDARTGPSKAEENPMDADIVVESLGPDSLPDVISPLRRGSLVVEPNGNLWVVPTTSRQARADRLLYDVYSPQGQLVERVSVPAGSTPVGFSRDGRQLFLQRRVADEQWVLQIGRVRR